VVKKKKEKKCSLMLYWI